MLYRHTNGSDKICYNTRLINSKTLTPYCTHPTTTHMCICLHVCAHTLSLCYTDSINKRDRNFVRIYSHTKLSSFSELLGMLIWWQVKVGGLDKAPAETMGLWIGEGGRGGVQMGKILFWQKAVFCTPVIRPGNIFIKNYRGRGGRLLGRRGVSPILWGCLS